MTAKRYVKTGALLAVLLVYAQSATAALWNDPNAIPSYRGSSPFPTSGVLDGYVDYAVYAPGNYHGYITDYVYAYQVFKSESPTVGIDYFSVGLSPDVQVPYAWWDPVGPGEPGGGITTTFVLPTSVLYVFPAGIRAGEHSGTLLFTSDCPPEMGIGVVPRGVAGSVNVDVPSPVPEPATFLLLGAGALLAFRRRSKS